MKIIYDVVRVSASTTQREVSQPDIGTVIATIPLVEIEMTAHSHPEAGTVKLAYVGDQAVAAKAKFKHGQRVAVDWASVEEIA